MKNIILMIGFAGVAAVAHAQLTTGPTGLTIKAGTPFSSQGLVLTPATDFTLQNDTIRLSGTAVTVGSGASIARVYTISPSVTFSGTLGVRYSASELNGNQENTMSVINAAPGAGFLSFASTTGSAGSYYVYRSPVPAIVLNRITATSTSVPLPVGYHSFAAVAGPACSIALSWSADQAQPGNFHVERSRDGKVFQSLRASVLQSGDRFSFTDPSPLPGKNMYRLAINETGEPVLYSAMVTANNPCALSSETKVYPNPAESFVTVALDHLPDGAATIELLDITGKTIKAFQTIEQVNTLDLQGIAAGSYFLNIQNGSSPEHIKIVKH